MLAALFAFLHHIAAFTLVSAVVTEFLVIRDEVSLKNARRLLTADLILGIAAATLLVVGVLRVLYFEKGADYYTHSTTFIAKVSLFLAVALLSIHPTREFLSWRKLVRQGKTPVIEARKIKSIRRVIHLELAGIAAIIFCAALMAKGIG
jgi:putative membrane protein